MKADRKRQPRRSRHAPQLRARPAISRQDWIAAAILAAVAIIVYIPAISKNFFWDDLTISQNPVMWQRGGLADIWFHPFRNTGEEHYWPFVHTIIWLQCRLWGFNGIGFHTVNVLLNSVNVVLLWILLRRMTVPGAFIAALVFAVHPVHVESVAWVIELKDQVSGIFYLLCALAFLRFRETRDNRFAIACVALYAAGMLSKSVVVTLPAVLLVWLYYRERRIDGRDIPLIGIMFGLGAVISFADVIFVRRHAQLEATTTSWQSFQLIGHTFWFYVQKLLWPHPLMPLYTRWQLVSNFAGYIPTLALLAFFAALAFIARKSRIAVAALAAFAFYFITLSPVLGFVDFGFARLSFVADRFQYLASIGPIALLGAGVARLPRRVQFATCAILAVVLGALTMQHAREYAQPEVLWRKNIKFNQHYEAYNQLGLLLGNQNRNAESIWAFDNVLRIKPDYLEAMGNLAAAYARDEKYDLARTWAEKALHFWPGYPEAHNIMGVVYVHQGKLAEAREEFITTLRLQPHNAEAAENLQILERDVASGRATPAAPK